MYDAFAAFYDSLTGDVDYPRRADYICRLFGRYGRKPSLVLDLACGTGSMTFELARAGFQMIGADRSPQMLSVAAEKAARPKRREAGKDILWLCQDMCALDLYGTVDAVVCCLDSINHLPDIRRVEQTFGRVSLFLNPGGLFIFDLNTEYKLSQVLGNHTYIYDEPGVYCVWQNHYLPAARRCDFDLTFFSPLDQNGGAAYERQDEHFSEHAYTPRQIGARLRKAGLDLLDTFAELTFDPPGAECERAVYIAQKRCTANG